MIKRFLPIFFLFLIIPCVSSQTLCDPDSALWNDEFTSYNSRWEWSYGAGTGYKTLTTIENLSVVETGITAATTSTAYSDSSLHETSYQYTTGIFESKLRCTDDNGFNSSGQGTRGWGFWNYQDPYSVDVAWFWSASPESDSSLRGLRAMVVINSSIVFNQPVTGIDIRQWHIYRVEISTSGTNFYVDGTQVASTTFHPLKPQRTELWIDNYQVSYIGGTFVPVGYLDVNHNQIMYVDWVRHFQTCNVIGQCAEGQIMQKCMCGGLPYETGYCCNSTWQSTTCAIPDTTFPVRSGGSPTGTLTAGTTSTTLSLSTNEAATCRYSTSAGTAYASMTNTFSGAGTTSHSASVSGFTNGQAYSYYVRCNDTAGNVNTDDYLIGFSVSSPADTTPPVRSSGSPTGTLAAGTTSTTMSLTTNESATCRYSTTSGTAYASMTNTLTTTGDTSHSSALSGFQNGTSYNYYVRCNDTAGNVNTDDYLITFSVASPPDTTPPVRSSGSPTGTLPAGTTSTTISLVTNEAATCRSSLTPGTAYSSMTLFSMTGGTSHSSPVTGLTDGTTYNIYVKCQDTAGNANSDDYIIAFSVSPDITPPTAPANLQATTISSSQINLNWTPSTDNVGVSGYMIYRNGTYLTSLTATSFQDAGLLPSTTYSYMVSAYDAAGNEGAKSSSASATTLSLAALVAAYSFNEGSGTSAVDSSGNGNSGTISGATRTSSGKYGKALNFDGTNDWVTVADSTSLDLTSGMTIEAWVYSTSVFGLKTVVLKEGAGKMAYGLYASTSTIIGRPGAYVFTTSKQGLTGTSSLWTYTWTHLAATYDGSIMKLYVNGNLVSTKAITGGSIATSQNALRIGGNSLASEFFRGRIDEVRIYNYARNQAEIATDMNASIA